MSAVNNAVVVSDPLSLLFYIWPALGEKTGKSMSIRVVCIDQTVRCSSGDLSTSYRRYRRSVRDVVSPRRIQLDQ